MTEQLSLPTPDQAKEQAIEQVLRNSLDFVSCAFEIVESLAKSRREFSAMDVWGLYDGPKPSHPRAMGAVFMRARKAGLIEPTNRWIKSGRVSDHNQQLRIWKSRIAA